MKLFLKLALSSYLILASSVGVSHEVVNNTHIDIKSETINFWELKEKKIYYDSFLEPNYINYFDNSFIDIVYNGINYWKKCVEENIEINLIDKNNYSNIKNFKIQWNENLEEHAYGHALITKKNDNIIEWIIELNPNKKLSEEKWKKVIAHEFGHIVNLPHTLDKDSVMFFRGIDMLNLQINKEKDNSICKFNLQEKRKF